MAIWTPGAKPFYSASVTATTPFSVTVDGDNDWGYEIFFGGTLICSAPGVSDAMLQLTFNGDTAANYRRVTDGYGWYGTDNNHSQSLAYWDVARTIAAQDQAVQAHTVVHAVSGTYRTGNTVIIIQRTASAENGVEQIGHAWVNTANNITTMTFTWANITSVDGNIIIRRLAR